jgi:hypothetical protein
VTNETVNDRSNPRDVKGHPLRGTALQLRRLLASVHQRSRRDAVGSLPNLRRSLRPLRLAVVASRHRDAPSHFGMTGANSFGVVLSLLADERALVLGLGEPLEQRKQLSRAVSGAVNRHAGSAR